jgi:hypothetical protein
MATERTLEFLPTLHNVKASALLGSIATIQDFSEHFDTAVPNAQELHLGRLRVNEVVPSPNGTFVRRYFTSELGLFVPHELKPMQTTAKDGKLRFYMSGVLHASGLCIESPRREQSSDIFTIRLAQVAASIQPNKSEQQGYLFEAWRSLRMPEGNK